MYSDFIKQNEEITWAVFLINNEYVLKPVLIYIQVDNLNSIVKEFEKLKLDFPYGFENFLYLGLDEEFVFVCKDYNHGEALLQMINYFK